MSNETKLTPGSETPTLAQGNQAVATAPVATPAPATEAKEEPNLKVIRTSLNLSQMEMAAKLGVTQGLISQCEKSGKMSKKLKAKVQELIESDK